MVEDERRDAADVVGKTATTRKTANKPRSGAAKGTKPAHGSNASEKQGGAPARRSAPRFAALDLGTNNCRLLIAAPRGRGFRVIDAFSRIVRLGEGLATHGRLSDEAMRRTIDALAVCADKIERRGVTRQRCIATQACRGASNGMDFLRRIKAETGLEFEIITTEEEARLAADGCIDLVDGNAVGAIVFDIGGGSTEVSCLRRNVDQGGNPAMTGWFSMPVGVVNLSEKWGGRDLSVADYENVVEDVAKTIKSRSEPSFWTMVGSADGHLIGTSGTVTSIAGVHLELTRYRRELVDGFWLSADQARAVSHRLLRMSFDERANEPCIGVDRADLVVCGCAILEALMRIWPAERIRVADRGLREGILANLTRKENARRRRRSGGRRRQA